MRKNWLNLAIGMAIAVPTILEMSGCSETSGPGAGAQSSETSLSSTTSIVSQDLAQLSIAGVTSDATKGLFSVGWRQFVGPNITESGTIGDAYAVVQSETSAATIRPAGIDIGAVTLAYDGGSTELTKRITRDGRVLYETFGKGMRLTQGTAVNIPFVANSTYSFIVSGSEAFPAGTFQVTAPASLLSIASHVTGDTVSRSADLTIQWNGGAASDSVLLRIVPHLRPSQMGGRGMHGDWDSTGGRGGKGGPKCRREGPFAVGGPLQDMGPAFAKGIVITVPNTGTYTVSAADLQALLSGTGAVKLMVGVTQVVKTDVVHEGSAVTVILRNGDRIVLHAM